MSTHEPTTHGRRGDEAQTTSTTNTEAGSDTSKRGRSDERSSAFTRDVVLEMFSNQRRRFAVHYLKRQPDHEASLRELAEQVACWQAGDGPDDLSYADRKSVQNALRQFHLPKLAEAGFVEYDGKRGTVRLTDAASEQQFYLDVVPSQSVPTGAYFLTLAGSGLLAAGGLWFEVTPFEAVPPTVWWVVLVAAFLATGAVYLYDNCYRVRLGALSTPAEVRNDS
jgi:hypothetical protein